MKIRTLHSGLLGLVVGLLCIHAAGSALAQGFMPPPYSPMQMQPSLLAPTNPTMYAGLFYFSAGVKYRNLAKVRSEVMAHTLSLGDPGAVPFGPETAGVVAYPYDAAVVPILPTGVLGDGPTISGIWVYDDGRINPRSVVAPAGFFQPPDDALGHYNVPPTNVGFFTVIDPSIQTNTGGGVYSETTSVNFSRILNASVAIAPEAGRESRIFALDSNPGTTFNWTEKIWTPYLEAGVQYSNYFDLFGGVSWFNRMVQFQRAYPVQVSLARRGFTDTFLFDSTNTTQSWLGNFSSNLAAGTLNPAETQTYVIFPVGRGLTGRPTRTFFEAVDPAVPTTPGLETVFNSFDFSPIEFRAGGRSWSPLWGLGRLGVTFGALTAFIPYTVVTSELLVATADNLGAGVTAGTVLINMAHKEKRTWYNMGMFGGMDLELGLWSTVFARTNAEYNFYFWSNSLSDGVVENVLDLGGFSGTLALGMRF